MLWGCPHTLIVLRLYLAVTDSMNLTVVIQLEMVENRNVIVLSKYPGNVNYFPTVVGVACVRTLLQFYFLS